MAIVPPFSEGENFFYSPEEQAFITFSNKQFEAGSTKMKLNDETEIEITFEGNSARAKLPSVEMETVQKFYDAVMIYTKTPQVKRFRGYVTLKKSGVIFDKQYKAGPEPETPTVTKEQPEPSNTPAEQPVETVEIPSPVIPVETQEKPKKKK
jgi:hypothetical protein